MKKRLTRIGILKCGIVLGACYALLSLIIVPFFMLAGLGASLSNAQGHPAPIFISFLFGIGAIFLPVIYGVLGFIGGIIFAAIYNLIAKMTGGLEFTVESDEPSSPPPL